MFQPGSPGRLLTAQQGSARMHGQPSADLYPSHSQGCLLVGEDTTLSHTPPDLSLPPRRCNAPDLLQHSHTAKQDFCKHPHIMPLQQQNGEYFIFTIPT